MNLSGTAKCERIVRTTNHCYDDNQQRNGDDGSRFPSFATTDAEELLATSLERIRRDFLWRADDIMDDENILGIVGFRIYSMGQESEESWPAMSYKEGDFLLRWHWSDATEEDHETFRTTLPTAVIDPNPILIPKRVIWNEITKVFPEIAKKRRTAA